MMKIAFAIALLFTLPAIAGNGEKVIADENGTPVVKFYIKTFCVMGQQFMTTLTRDYKEGRSISTIQLMTVDSRAGTLVPSRCKDDE